MEVLKYIAYAVMYTGIFLVMYDSYNLLPRYKILVALLILVIGIAGTTIYPFFRKELIKEYEKRTGKQYTFFKRRTLRLFLIPWIGVAIGALALSYHGHEISSRAKTNIVSKKDTTTQGKYSAPHYIYS